MSAFQKKSVRAKHSNRLGRLLALLPATCILFYPIYLAGQLDLVTDEKMFSSLPAVFDGLRIAYVSDIHYGPYLNEARVRSLVQKINALEPDLILLGGDYAEDSATAIDFFALRPDFQARYGVIGVMGNHDRTPPEKCFAILQEEMRSAGVTPLVNDVLLLEREGYTLALAGVDDYYNGHPDLSAVENACRKADFAIFLPHTPDVLPETFRLPEGPFYQLALSGHTHGGQVTIGGHAVKSSSLYGNRYLSGWFSECGVEFLVSNGVGTSFLPVRLGARPQMHLLILRAGKE